MAPAQDDEYDGPESGHESAHLVVGIILVWSAVAVLIFSLSFLCLACLRRLPCRHAGSLTRFVALRMREACHHLWCAKDEKLIGLARQRYSQAQKMTGLGLLYVVFTPLLMYLVFHKRAALWGAVVDVDWAQRSLTDRSVLATLVLVSVPILLGAAFPRWTTQRSISCFHALVLARFACQLAFARTAEHHMYHNGWMTCGRLIFAIVSGDPLSTIVLNVGFTAVDVALMQQQSYPAGLSSYFVREVFGLMTICCVSLLFYSSIVSEAQRTLEAELLDKVLSAMCDAVVHLRDDLSIKHPSPKLAVLLLRSPFGKALKGHSFLELAPSGPDRDRLQQCISADIGSMALPQLLHTNLLDANGTSVPVEIIYFWYQDLDDKMSCIVGVQDVGEEQRTITPDTLNVQTVGACDSFSVICEDIDFISFQPPEIELGIWIDCADPGYRIVRCTDGFAALSAQRSLGSKFLDWVPASAMLAEWVHCSVYAYLEGATLPSPLLAVVLQPPCEGRAEIQLTADVEVGAVQEGGQGASEESECCGSDGGDGIFVFLKLTNVMKTRSKRRQQMQRTPASGAGDNTSAAASSSVFSHWQSSNILVWCVAGSLDLKIIRCTALFAKLVGTSACFAGFRDIVCEADDFKLWLHEHAQAGGSACSDIVSTEVALRGLHPESKKEHVFLMTCFLSFESPTQQVEKDLDSAIPQPGLVVRLEFFHSTTL